MDWNGLNGLLSTQYRRKGLRTVPDLERSAKRSFGSAAGSVPCTSGATRRTPNLLLRQDLFDHSSVDVRQAVITSAVPVGQLFVIEAHLVKDRRVQVVHMNF